MIKLDYAYSDYVDVDDPAYPAGKAVDAATDEGLDGTPYLAKWMNDINGFRQALFLAAFGNLATLSGVPDNVNNSDSVDAILKLIHKAFSDTFFIKQVSGRETVIPWADLQISYNSSKKYAVFISANGNFPEFISFGSDVADDGLHVFPRKILNGEIIGGTRVKRWGAGSWGSFIYGAASSMDVNIIIREVE